MRCALFAGAVALVFLTTSGSARAFCRSKTCGENCTPDPVTTCPMEGLPLAWSGSCLSYSVSWEGKHAISEEELAAASETAFDAWRDAHCASPAGSPTIAVRNPFGPATCGRVEYNPLQANANIIVLRETWNHGAGVLALTTVSYSKITGEIYDADIEVNATLPIAVGPVLPDHFDLQSILTHEAGHFLGLAHSNVRCPVGATMCPRYDPGVDAFRTLDEDDEAAICTVYPPSRSARCDSAPRQGFSPECGLDPMTSKGCSLANAGRPSPARTTGAILVAVGLGLRRFRRARRGQKRT